ncbi:MAG: LamG-like jellyroll fold domain-containing protein [Pirellulaceae bacterium]
MMKQIVKILLIAIASTALLNAPLAAQIASEKTTAGKSATEKASESQSVESTPELPLTDKTLVVWVAPANLKQRGGSALTIEDGSDHFDGIVFGELTPAKWMAGSDAFTRTQRDQSDWPAETAEGATYIQLAIVYQGKQISVFRNGRLYSQHVMAALPQEFGARSIVGIGKRHRAQGDNSHFAGSIDDARIYDYALSANQLAELEPNVAADCGSLGMVDLRR